MHVPIKKRKKRKEKRKRPKYIRLTYAFKPPKLSKYTQSLNKKTKIHKKRLNGH